MRHRKRARYRALSALDIFVDIKRLRIDIRHALSAAALDIFDNTSEK